MNHSRLLSFVWLVSACAHAAPESGTGPAESRPGVRVPLVYEAADSRPPEGGVTRLRLRIWLSAFTDERTTDRETIGTNEVDGLPVSVFATTKVADMVTDGFRREFERLHGPLVPTSVDVARSIRGQVHKFWVNAGRTYRADVQLTIQVIDPVLGSTVYERKVDGSDHTFGSIASPKNDAQVLSGAVREAVLTVLNDPTFVAALGGR